MTHVQDGTGSLDPPSETKREPFSGATNTRLTVSLSSSHCQSFDASPGQTGVSMITWQHSIAILVNTSLTFENGGLHHKGPACRCNKCQSNSQALLFGLSHRDST